MSSPIRPPAQKSILLVWILNLLLPGLGNVYASGLSALRWLVIGILIRVFVHHLGVLLGTYVLLSLMATGEIIANADLRAAKQKILPDPKLNFGRRQPKAINAPDESLQSILKVQHANPPSGIDQLTDEFVRSHLKSADEKAAAQKTEDAVNNLGYGDIRAGQLTYDTLGSPNSSSGAIEMPQPFNYSFQEYKFDSLNYQNVGTLPKAEGDSFTCPHCGVTGQTDFSFCLSCGHAYAIG